MWLGDCIQVGLYTGSPICLILPSRSCLSCLYFHLIFAVEIFLLIRRRSAPDRLPCWRRFSKSKLLCVIYIFRKLWYLAVYVAHVFYSVRTDFSIFLLSWFLVLFSFSISLWMTWNMSFGGYVFLSIEMYCYRKDENIEISLNHLLLTVRNWNISLFIWIYNKALINRDLGPYGKNLF